MSRLIPLIAALLIVIRPLSGCCECHAPLLAAVISTWHEVWSGEHAEHQDDCCQHSSPCTDFNHQDGKCPSCESTQDFVKVAAPQVAKASAIARHFSAVILFTRRAEVPALCRNHVSLPLAEAGLRAHLVLGVMLI